MESSINASFVVPPSSSLPSLATEAEGSAHGNRPRRATLAKVLHYRPRCPLVAGWTAEGLVEQPEIQGMPHLIHQHTARVKAPDGTEYCAHTYGEARPDGTWSGWIEFAPANGRGAVLSTDQETSQPDRKAVEYWAGGLERVYLEGALSRALRLSAIS